MMLVCHFSTARASQPELFPHSNLLGPIGNSNVPFVRMSFVMELDVCVIRLTVQRIGIAAADRAQVFGPGIRRLHRDPGWGVR
jgi:hypothetical protein